MPTFFRDKYDPNTDIIYGRGETINAYLMHYYYARPGAVHPAVAGPPRRSEVPRNIRGVYPYGPINPYNTEITERRLGVQNGSVVETRTGTSHNQDQSDYQRALNKTTFSPDRVLTDVPAQLNALRKSNANLNSKSSIQVAMAANDLSIRRSCKFGLLYFTDFGTVHYATDGISSKVVLEKTAMKNESMNFPKIPICTSEIRFLFRVFNRFPGRIDNRQVIFYNDFQIVPAPWESGSEAAIEGWAEYAIQRVEKHRVGVAAQAKDRLAAFDAEVSSWKKIDTSKVKLPAAMEAQLQSRDKWESPHIQFGTAPGPLTVIEAFHAIPWQAVNRDFTL